MPNTYTQIYLHVVFAVKHRHGLIRSEWKEDLYRYMTGIVQYQGHKLIAINAMPDHVHVFVGVCVWYGKNGVAAAQILTI